MPGVVLLCVSLLCFYYDYDNYITIACFWCHLHRQCATTATTAGAVLLRCGGDQAEKRLTVDGLLPSNRRPSISTTCIGIEPWPTIREDQLVPPMEPALRTVTRTSSPWYEKAFLPCCLNISLHSIDKT